MQENGLQGNFGIIPKRHFRLVLYRSTSRKAQWCEKRMLRRELCHTLPPHSELHAAAAVFQPKDGSTTLPELWLERGQGHASPRAFVQLPASRLPPPPTGGGRGGEVGGEAGGYACTFLAQNLCSQHVFADRVKTDATGDEVRLRRDVVDKHLRPTNCRPPPPPQLINPGAFVPQPSLVKGGVI